MYNFEAGITEYHELSNSSHYICERPDGEEVAGFIAECSINYGDDLLRTTVVSSIKLKYNESDKLLYPDHRRQYGYWV